MYQNLHYIAIYQFEVVSLPLFLNLFKSNIFIVNSINLRFTKQGIALYTENSMEAALLTAPVKVLVVGGRDLPSVDNRAIARGFELVGCSISSYYYRDRLQELGVERRDEELCRLCHHLKPELVFICKGEGIGRQVFEKINQVSSTCFWYMDPMWNFDKEMREKVELATFTCCGLERPAEEAKKYGKNVYFVPQTYDPLDHHPFSLPKTHEATFIGNIVPKGEYHSERALYHKLVKFQVLTGLYNQEHAKAVSQSLINLNFTESDRGGTSVRLFKLLAAGGFVLSMPWTGMEKLFSPGEDFVIFNTPHELQEKIRYYLKHEEERERIAQNGHSAVQKYANRYFAGRILEIFRSLA